MKLSEVKPGQVFSPTEESRFGRGEFIKLSRNNGTNITYNPYKYETFVDKATELPVVSAKSAFLFRGGVLASL
jgi:hypothetical protein